jgi:cyclopropane fatty-acyl-phospholipid synthase-like methyltransferase
MLAMDKEAIHQKAEHFFEHIWEQEDAWALDSSSFEQARYDALMANLESRRYGKVLEIGCGAGAFTVRLVPLADHVIALDVSTTAVTKARRRLADVDQVSFRTANVMESELADDGPFDLIVLSETIYYLGWLYPFFDLAWLASQLHAVTTLNGRLLLANTLGIPGEYLMLPWLIRTYHDLFRNVGYTVENESTFRGVKDGVAIEVLITLFRRAD